MKIENKFNLFCRHYKIVLMAYFQIMSYLPVYYEKIKNKKVTRRV